VDALAALRVRAFRHLAAAYTINELGNWIGDVALAILVFDQTGSPLATATLFLALRFSPALLAPLATTRAEVLPPRWILSALYLAEAVVFGAIALLARSFSLPAVLALAALDGVLAITARALIRGVIAALLVPQGLLRQGNAVIALGVTVGAAVGPAIAGALVATAGPSAALALDAGSFVTVSVAIATAPGLRLDSDRTTGMLGRLHAGLREAWAIPATRRLLIGTAAALVFGAEVIPIEVVFAKRTLHAGDYGYGMLMASWGLGMVVGGVAFAGSSHVRLTTMILAGIGFIAAGYAGLAGSPDLAVACAFSAVGGIGNGLWWIAVVTSLQQAIASSAQSAVMALLESINQVMPALGYILGGVVTALGSPRLAYGTAAGGVVIVLLVHSLRPLETPDNQRSTGADATRWRSD
jgi:MFS family permease